MQIPIGIHAKNEVVYFWQVDLIVIYHKKPTRSTQISQIGNKINLDAFL